MSSGIYVIENHLNGKRYFGGVWYVRRKPGPKLAGHNVAGKEAKSLRRGCAKVCFDIVLASG